MAQGIKSLPSLWDTWVLSLGWEDPLEKEMAPLQYSCLGNPMDGGPEDYSPLGHKELDTTERLHFRL